MNYIAHLAIAEHTATDLVGALLGDFVKGTKLQAYSAPVAMAVKLHRTVDSTTDSMPEIVRLKQLFPKPLRRYAGIGLDVYFDHVLLSQWQQWHRFDLNDLLSRFYDELHQYQGQVPLSFEPVKQGLLVRRWLVDYQHRETCLRALYRVESRFRRRHSFAASLYEVLCECEPAIAEGFSTMYPKLMEKARLWVDSERRRTGDVSLSPVEVIA